MINLPLTYTCIDTILLLGFNELSHRLHMRFCFAMISLDNVWLARLGLYKICGDWIVKLWWTS